LSTRRIGALLAFLCLLEATPARAEVEVNDFDVNLYGRWWRVLSYFVEDDVLSNPNDDTFLEPEGLAFADQVLYVSGDREEDESDSRLAMYDHPVGGVLTFNDYLQMSIQGDQNGWGPEGLTFNPSGSGYGSAANELVSVERDGTGRAGVINLDTGRVTDFVTTSTPEDVTYLSVAPSFATLQDAGGPVSVAFHDASFVPSGTTITVAPTANGAAGVSAAFASFLTRTSVSGESLLTVLKENPGNAIKVYGLDGGGAGPRQDLPVVPRARIPLGGGFFLFKPAFGTIEAVAVDETAGNEVIYIGDEGNSMVHVLTPGFMVGDFDEDGDVDQGDYDQFVLCFTGPGGGPIAPECVPGDAEPDDDCDCHDWGTFAQNWTGPPLELPAFSQCSEALPALSEWGVGVLALILLGGGLSLLVGRRAGGASL
jgi:hypothetical protein